MQQLTIQMRKPKIEQPQALLLSIKRDTCERLFVSFTEFFVASIK